MTQQNFTGDQVKVDALNIDAFRERISVAIDRAGGATSMSQKAGVSSSVLRKWRSGQSEPSRTNLIKMAIAADVSVEWLVAGEGGLEATSQVEPLGMDDYAFVPLYDAQCSAGDGAWNENSRVLTYICFTRYSLRKQGLTPDHLSAIRIDGDSMEPVLNGGDTVLIDHTRTAIKGEGIYVLRFDGHLYAKRLQRNFDGVVIISANKEYAPVNVPRDRLDELEVIGRAVWSAGWL